MLGHVELAKRITYLSGRLMIEIANLFYDNQILRRAQDDKERYTLKAKPCHVELAKHLLPVSPAGVCTGRNLSISAALNNLGQLFFLLFER
ncbi:MAG: hypothetical protein NVV82_26370 [Sporocytophaga sp.]|nr:hypothetical protein [Sporocytophaga sp.]